MMTLGALPSGRQLLGRYIYNQNGLLSLTQWVNDHPFSASLKYDTNVTINE